MLSRFHKCISFLFSKVAVNGFSDLHEVPVRGKRCLAGTFDVLMILLDSRSMSSPDRWGWNWQTNACEEISASTEGGLCFMCLWLASGKSHTDEKDRGRKWKSFGKSLKANVENGGRGKGLIPRAASCWGLKQNRCKMQRSNKLDRLTKPLIPYLLKRALIWKRLFLRSFQSVSGQYGYLPFQPFCERFAVTFNVWHVSCDFWNWVFCTWWWHKSDRGVKSLGPSLLC